MPEEDPIGPNDTDAGGDGDSPNANGHDSSRYTTEHEGSRNESDHEDIQAMPPDDGPDTVLVVEDEEGIANLYSKWLGERYEVRVANTGREGLDELGEAVDVVLLDRRLPDISGSEVLAEIRRQDLDCQVAMVTAVDPDVDVLEMGFDDYVTKPMTRDDLLSLVADLVARKEYSAAVQQYFRLVSKRAALERELVGDLADHPEYDALCEEIAALENSLGELVDGFTETDFQAQFYRFSDEKSAASD